MVQISGYIYGGILPFLDKGWFILKESFLTLLFFAGIFIFLYLIWSEFKSLFIKPLRNYIKKKRWKESPVFEVKGQRMIGEKNERQVPSYR